MLAFAVKALYATTAPATSSADFTVEQTPANIMRRTFPVGQPPSDLTICELIRDNLLSNVTV